MFYVWNAFIFWEKYTYMFNERNLLIHECVFCSCVIQFFINQLTQSYSMWVCLMTKNCQNLVIQRLKALFFIAYRNNYWILHNHMQSNDMPPYLNALSWDPGARSGGRGWGGGTGAPPTGRKGTPWLRLRSVRLLSYNKVICLKFLVQIC